MEAKGESLFPLFTLVLYKSYYTTLLCIGIYNMSYIRLHVPGYTCSRFTSDFASISICCSSEIFIQVHFNY